MDAAVVKTLNDSLNKVLVQPELAKQLEIEAIDPMPMSPQEFAEYARLDYERWAKLAKEQNISLTA
jgi:tripartite-type tricarboxylate transporter receptor subunit TctC